MIREMGDFLKKEIIVLIRIKLLFEIIAREHFMTKDKHFNGMLSSVEKNCLDL